MKVPRVTITFQGSPDDGNKLRLDDFIRGLSVIIDALKNTEKRLTGSDRANIHYKIINLSQNSPATVTIEPIYEIPEDRNISLYPKETINTFLSDLSLIKRRKIVPENLDFHSIQKYVEISSLRTRHITRVIIKNGHRTIDIDDKFKRNIDTAIGPDEFEDGSLSGRLEAVNTHTGNRFYIYPSIGPKKVQCNFPPELKKEVKDALYERVEIKGVLRYKSWDKFPYAINVKSLITYLPDEQLPTFTELVGVAPDATGGVRADEFIRKLRDEEW